MKENKNETSEKKKLSAEEADKIAAGKGHHTDKDRPSDAHKLKKR